MNLFQLPVQSQAREHRKTLRRGAINRGDIYYGSSPHEHSADLGQHPYVVVQENVFNHSSLETVVACVVSSKLHCLETPGVILLDPGEGGLERHSVVLSSQVSCLPKTRLGAYVGSLTNVRTDQIVNALRLLNLLSIR